MPEKDLAAVILAAGLSTRFGGSLKALRPLCGKTFLERMVGALREGGVNNILVVTGHQAEECAALAESLGVHPVCNQQYYCGMFSSVQAGLRAVQNVYPKTSAVLLAPVDAALVMPRSVRALVEAWRRQLESPNPQRIIIPSLNGRHGHPVLLPAVHIPRVLERPVSGEPAPKQDPDAPLGLRGYYHEMISDRATCQMENYLNFLHPCAETNLSDQCIINIPLPDAGVLSDIDTAKDSDCAETFINHTEGRALPSVDEAWQLLGLSQLSPKKMRHSLLVAQGSLRIGLKLEAAGHPQNHLLLITAGLLHDVLRMHSEHAVHGAALLEELGWPKAAFVVGAHTRLPDAYCRRMGIEVRDTKFKTVKVPSAWKQDKKLADEMFYGTLSVYMADKYARRDKFSTIKERFKDIYDWFREKPGAFEGILVREEVVNEVEKWLSAACGCDLLETVKTPTRHTLECELDRAVDGLC